MKPSKKLWAREEDERLARLLKGHGTEDIARIMGRSPRSITARRRRLKLKVIIRGSGPKTQHMWTRAEEARLYTLAETVPRAEAAKLLGRTLGSVRQKCLRLGFSWRAGFTSAADLAREFKIHETPVATILELLFPAKKPIKLGHRWKLTDEEADHARKYLVRWKQRRKAQKP